MLDTSIERGNSNTSRQHHPSFASVCLCVCVSDRTTFRTYSIAQAFVWPREHIRNMIQYNGWAVVRSGWVARRLAHCSVVSNSF